MNLQVPSLLKRWKRLQASMDASAESFDSLSTRFEHNITTWLKADKNAQLNRKILSASMDIYDIVAAKGMTLRLNTMFPLC